MKRSNLVIVLLFILIIITSSVYFISSIKTKKQLDRVEGLYNYFNTKDLEVCEGLFNYSDKKITEEDVNDETKICLAYKQSEKSSIEQLSLKKDKKGTVCTKDKMVFRVNDDEKECSYTKISKSVINDTYKKIFGKDFSSDIKSFQADNLTVCYIKEDNIYCGLSETFTYTIGESINVYRAIEKVNEKGSSVEIYDYFLKTVGDKCYNYYTTSNENEECSNKIVNMKKVKYKFLKNNGTLYKHLYEKDENGVYHWISTEPVKSE